MPEFEENTDTAKSAPYTYEPSKSTATELAGTIVTPSGDSSSQPTKSRWGKRAESSSSKVAASQVPAGEVNLDGEDDLVDSISAKGKARPEEPQGDEEITERPNRSRRSDGSRSRSGRGERSGSRADSKAEPEDGEADRPKSRSRRSRSRTSSGKGSADDQPRENRGDVHEDEPETFADKIIKWIRKLVTGGEIEQEKEAQPRRSGNGRRRSSSGGSSSGRRRRRPGGNDGENRRSSGDGSNGGSGSRRRRNGGGRSRRSSAS